MATGKASIDLPRVLFTIEQRITVGAVLESEYGNDRHPVAMAMDIIAARLIEASEHGDDTSFSFTYEGVTRTVTLEHGS